MVSTKITVIKPNRAPPSVLYDTCSGVYPTPSNTYLRRIKRMLELYVVEYESANYAGAGSHCVVWASCEEEAQDLTAVYFEDFYREQDEDQYVDEGMDPDDVCWASFQWAAPLIGSEYEEYYADPVQRDAFYQCVNPEDAPK